MHRKMLMDNIKKQAGTLGKALLEGSMNAVEAGCSRLNVSFGIHQETNVATLILDDDGRGIVDKEELIQHFETFGTPHEEHEAGPWKKFRIGRGQLFAFGKNVWRTATFEMEVDINERGLKYTLREGLPFHQGCRIEIELYENPIPSWYSTEGKFREAYQKQVKYFETEIYYNGEMINTPPSSCKWDHEDEFGYYTFLKTGALDIELYNIGAYVCEMSAMSYGICGTVVTKKQLDLNSARNQVISTCPVYAHVKDIIKQNRVKRRHSTKRRNFNTHERQSALMDLLVGDETYDSLKSLKLVATAQGKLLSLEEIRKSRLNWTFAPYGDRRADKLMETEQAIVFDEAILERLNYPTNDEHRNFFNWLFEAEELENGRIPNGWESKPILYQDFDELVRGIRDDYTTIPQSKWTKTEKRVMRLLQNGNCWDGRVLRLGMSDTADAWTDGQTYITINRDRLRMVYWTYGSSLRKLMSLLCHEMAHDDDSRGTHHHGPEFYERYYDIVHRQEHCPMDIGYGMYQKLKDAQIQEKIDAELAKRQKAKEKREKKISGSSIAASSK